MPQTANCTVVEFLKIDDGNGCKSTASEELLTLNGVSVTELCGNTPSIQGCTFNVCQKNLKVAANFQVDTQYFFFLKFQNAATDVSNNFFVQTACDNLQCLTCQKVGATPQLTATRFLDIDVSQFAQEIEIEDPDPGDDGGGNDGGNDNNNNNGDGGSNPNLDAVPVVITLLAVIVILSLGVIFYRRRLKIEEKKLPSILESLSTNRRIKLEQNLYDYDSESQSGVSGLASPLSPNQVRYLRFSIDSRAHDFDGSPKSRPPLPARMFPQVVSYKSNISAYDKMRLNDKTTMSGTSNVDKTQLKAILDNGSMISVKQGHDLKALVDKVVATLVPQIIPVEKIKDGKDANSDLDLESFNRKEEPKVDMYFYLERLIGGLDRWFSQEHEKQVVGSRCLLLSLVYLKRLKGFQLTALNIHQMFAMLMFLSAKFLEDDIITVDYWAEIVGFASDHVRSLEQDLFKALKFDLSVDGKELAEVYEEFGFNGKSLRVTMQSYMMNEGYFAENLV